MAWLLSFKRLRPHASGCMAHDASGPVLPVSLRSGALRLVAWLNGACVGSGEAGGKETVSCGGPWVGCGGGVGFGTPGAGEEGSSLSSPHSHDTCPPRFSTSTHHVSLRLETSTSVSLIRFPATILCCFISLYETLILWGDFAGSMRPCGGKTLKCHGNVS